MKDVRGAMIFLLLLLCEPLWAAGGAVSMPDSGPHGSLGLVLNGQTLVAQLTLPAMQVVGFARAPGDNEERQLVSEALQRLGKADNVLIPVAAGCDITQEEADSSLASPAEAEAAGGKVQKADADSAFHGRYAWHCSNPAALQAVNVPLLEFMNGVALDVLVVSGGEQRSLTLRFPDTNLVIGGGR